MNMHDPVNPDLAADPVISPCVGICRMTADGVYCEGCLRTIDEIAAWSRLGNDGKRLIWQRIEQRKAALQARPASAVAPVEVQTASQKAAP